MTIARIEERLEIQDPNDPDDVAMCEAYAVWLRTRLIEQYPGASIYVYVAPAHRPEGFTKVTAIDDDGNRVSLTDWDDDYPQLLADGWVEFCREYQYLQLNQPD